MRTALARAWTAACTLLLASGASISPCGATPGPPGGPPPPDLNGIPSETLPAHIAAWNAAHDVSDDARWRRVMAWRRPFDTPLTWTATAPEQSPARYPDPAGQSDPALDLVASIVAAHADVHSFGCRFPLRTEALADLGVLPRPTPLMAGACTAFERWANLEAVDGVELVFATPSFAEPATTAGHILFRVRSHPRADTAPVAEAVWSYGVDLSRPEARSGRLLKGLVGELRGEVLSETARDLDRRYGIVDRRDLWIYDLRLDRRELRLLLARLWVQQRDDSHGGYSFFSVNCARLTHDTLRAVMGDLRRRQGWFMHPHEVLTELWRARRLVPRGIIYSRRSRARRGEAIRAQIAPTLAAVPGFFAAHRAAQSRAADRAQRFAAIGQPVDPPLRDALTLWADATLDVELYVADAATDAAEARAAARAESEDEAEVEPEDGVDPVEARLRAGTAELDHPALDAALALRARLPPSGATARLDPFPQHSIGPSGSRRATVGLGFDGTSPITRLRVGIVDEQPGEARAVALRRSSRFEFLVSETAVAWPLEVDWPTIQETRLVLVSTTDFGVHVEAIEGPLAARLDLLVDVGLRSAPASGAPFGAWLRLGEGLTVLTAQHDRGFWVVGVDAQILGTVFDEGADGEPVRGELGAWTEVIAPLGRHHLRLTGRTAPGWGVGGFALFGSLDGRLDLLLDPGRPIFLSPYGRWRRGGLEDGWEAGLALSF